MINKTEILAPAGSLDAFYAAMAAGADAVYLGGKAFGARANATNFTLPEIKELIRYAHIRDKKVYVTVNTIIFEDEFSQALEFVGNLYYSDVDAIIIQDLGLAMVIREKYPDLALHASTQMNIHNWSMAKKIQELGFKRIILPREMNIDQIRAIKEKVDIELEIFIHGALCVSYSGNCYFSSFLGKRSGNRGQCAQPCRLPYRLEGKEKYWLSPKDLCTLDRIKELQAIGITSFKIEGRMKRPEYVAQVVKSYQKAVNHQAFNIEQEDRRLRTVFNRDWTKGFLFKEENKNFSNIEQQNHVGVYIGKVVSTYQDKVNIKLLSSLRYGDSIRLVGKLTDAVTINQMYVKDQLVKEAKAKDIVTIKTHLTGLEGAKVYLTTDRKQIDELTKFYRNDPYQVDIEGVCYLENNQVVFSVTDGAHKVVQVCLEKPEPANSDQTKKIKEQLEKTANTIFRFQKLQVRDNFFLPIKSLNQLRRDSLSALEAMRAIKYPNRKARPLTEESLNHEGETAGIKVRVRTEAQYQKALSFPVKAIYLSDEGLYHKYKENPDVRYYLPRNNQKRIEEKVITTDYSLLPGNINSVYTNVTNSFSVRQMEKLGAKTVGLSVELSFRQIKDLLEGYVHRYGSYPSLEMMVYGRHELMTMSYCPINKALGKEKKNCGECLKKQIYLTDRFGYRFPLIRDEECNLIVLNGKRLHLLPYLKEIIDAGVKNLILDFSLETDEEVEKILKLYFAALQNENIDSEEIKEVTYGHFQEAII